MIYSIDLGSFKTSVGQYDGKTYDILLNEIGQRETQNLVAIRNDQRLMGESAFLQQKSNLQNTFQFFTRFLGELDQKSLEFEKSFIFNEIFFKSQELQLNIQVFNDAYYTVQNYFRNVQQISSVQTLAFFLKNLMKNKQIISGYLAVPNHFNQIERINVYQALEIAQLNQFQIINQNDSIALGYDYLKQPKNQNILFVDFGHSKLSISLYKYSQNKIYLLRQRNYKDFGVRTFDLELSKFYIKKYNLNLQKNNKCRLRLMDAISKQRKELSANQDSSIYIESFIDGEDFNHLLKRNEYMQILGQQLFEFRQYLEEFLDLTVDTVEILGGGSRIPIIQEIINQVFVNKLKKSLNSSETIALGSFNKIDNDKLILINPNSYTYKVFQNNNLSNNGQLFKIDDKQPFQKAITFDCNSDFIELQIYENDIKIDCFQIQIKKKYNKIQLDFQIEPNQILIMKKCCQFETQIYQDKQLLLNNDDFLISYQNQLRYDQQTMISYKNIEQQMQKNDLDIIDGQEKKNQCESILYHVQSQINENKQFFESQQINQLQDKITQYLNQIETTILEGKKYMAIIYEINHNFEPFKQKIKCCYEIKEKIKIMQGILDRLNIEKDNNKNVLFYYLKKKQLIMNKIQNLSQFIFEVQQKYDFGQFDKNQLMNEINEKIQMFQKKN